MLCNLCKLCESNYNDVNIISITFMICNHHYVTVDVTKSLTIGILDSISKELQVQHPRFCRGAHQTAGEEICPCLRCSSKHWGETITSTHIVQAFVVAGGVGPSGRLSSVLTLLQGAGNWTRLASLPRALDGARASVVGGKLRVTGGFDGVPHRSEVMVKLHL